MRALFTSEWDRPREWPNSWAATWNRLVPARKQNEILYVLSIATNTRRDKHFTLIIISSTCCSQTRYYVQYAIQRYGNAFSVFFFLFTYIITGLFECSVQYGIQLKLSALSIWLHFERNDKWLQVPVKSLPLISNTMLSTRRNAHTGCNFIYFSLQIIFTTDCQDCWLLIITSERIYGPGFAVVKVSIAAIDGEVGVGQSSARAVKGITVAVFATLKTDFNVNFSWSYSLERQVRHIWPHLNMR